MKLSWLTREMFEKSSYFIKFFMRFMFDIYLTSVYIILISSVTVLLNNLQFHSYMFITMIMSVNSQNCLLKKKNRNVILMKIYILI